jgi:hypothetical protein
MNEQQLREAREAAQDARESGRYTDGFTIENKGDMFAVYGWGTYPDDSVLAGQTMKSFIDGFDTEECARTVWPEIGGDTFHRSANNSVAHLPGENDPVPGGMYPDDGS